MIVDTLVYKGGQEGRVVAVHCNDDGTWFLLVATGNTLKSWYSENVTLRRPEPSPVPL